jgi:hypothetical protein
MHSQEMLVSVVAAGAFAALEIVVVLLFALAKKFGRWRQGLAIFY